MSLTCPKCGTASSGRFCHACGAPVDAGTPLARSDHWSWFFAGGAVALGIGGLVLGLSPVRLTSSSDNAEGGPLARPQQEQGAAPDISALSPRERFDRLYNRVMQAAESGDQATVDAFAPMAVQAYAMLDQVDIDARYHLALILLHSGGLDQARAQGDSIEAAEPGHLFGYLVQGAIARYQKDQLALDTIYRAFLAHYPAEEKRGRPEYAEHGRALDDFAKAARTATGGKGT
jgi:hypothetical protein